MTDESVAAPRAPRPPTLNPADIEARLKAATPGPWEATVNEAEDGHNIRMADAITSPGNHESAHLLEYEHMNYPGEPGWDEAEANAEFIAHAPEDVAALLGALREMRAALQFALDATTVGPVKWFVRSEVGDEWNAWRGRAARVLETVTDPEPVVGGDGTPQP